MYLRMHKLQYLNTTYNLLTKFYPDKASPFQFIKFLTWYEVTTWTGNNPRQMKFIGDVINVITLIYLKKILGT